MKNLKKALALLLVIVLTASATLGITLAVLTDKSEVKHNVFNVGKVNVEVTEEVGGITAGGVTEKADGAEYNLVTPGDHLKKEVTVKNTGDIPAYVAVTVTMNNADKINNAIDEWYENDPYYYDEAKIQAIYDYVFENWGLNYTKTDADGNATGMRLTITGDDMPDHTLQVDSVKTIDEYSIPYTQNWFEKTQDVIPFDGYYTTGMGEYEFKWTYYMLLDDGEESVLFTGLNVPLDFNNDQIAMFEGLDIKISAAAIQAENFADPIDAFKALHAEQNGGFVAESYPATVANVDELNGALAGDQDVVLGGNITVPAASAGSNGYGATGISIKNGQTFDGDGNKFGVNKWGTWDTAINTTGGVIKNVTINSGMRGIFVNHDSSYSEPVILDNVIIDGTIYTISCDQGLNQGLIATDSTFNGWTSYAATIGDVEFTNCSFGSGQGYAYCRPFAPTTFVGCDFAAGYEIEAKAAVTFENCTFGGQPLTEANIDQLVIGGMSYVTVK